MMNILAKENFANIALKIMMTGNKNQMGYVHIVEEYAIAPDAPEIR